MKRNPPAVQQRSATPLRKERTIRFSEIPPGQVAEAAAFLGGLPGLEIRFGAQPLCLELAYDLLDYSLEDLENTLIDKGFHLDSTLLTKMMRALFYYVEETEMHNLEAPEHLLKKPQNEAYVQAWERHSHGDHDDTPPEWREYK